MQSYERDREQRDVAMQTDHGESRQTGQAALPVGEHTERDDK
jgi:hypothetical protein